MKRAVPRTTLYAAALALALAAVALTVGAPRAQTPVPAAMQSKGKVIAIVGGAIYPISSAPIPDGTLLMRDGKIESIGGLLEPPLDAEVIDAKGLSVYPGFVSAWTTLGLTEVGSVRQSNDYEEVGALNPNARTMIAINPESELIPVSRANGVTTALAVPRGGRLSGLSTLFHLDGWTFEDMSVLSPAALHLQWPGMAINHAPDAKPSAEEQLANQAKTLRELDQLFDDARATGPRAGPPARSARSGPTSIRAGKRWARCSKARRRSSSMRATCGRSKRRSIGRASRTCASSSRAATTRRSWRRG
ncbi:MAG: hypothetical protein U0527_00635 [Candidatus Eisenbacteria bacterium]